MKKQLLISILIISFLLIGTILVIFYGRGYRFDFNKGKPDLSGTGLLVTTSSPDGAQVFINNHLTTATNNTINLAPEEYKVKIYKEGFFPWEKKIKIQKEVVVKVEALLFPNAPKLDNITSSGVENPVIDPSLTRVAYTVSSQSARKNGIYILDMTTKPILTLQSASTQIIDDTIDSFSKASLSWSPDGQELLATISAKTINPTTYLLKTGGFNQSPQDVTATLANVKNSWQKEKEEKEKALLATLKPELLKVISEDFKIIAWSADENKILYQASSSAVIPIIIKPRLIGVDSTPEEREFKKDSIYVYDIKEDKNYKINIGNSQVPKGLSWFPDSKHLIFVNDKKINILDYDGENIITVYAGPFVDNYVFPWPNGSKLLILTNLNNPEITPNLYTIGLK